MPDYSIIDADTHITEPADVWTSRVARKWRDRVPSVKWDAKEKEEAWFLAISAIFLARENSILLPVFIAKIPSSEQRVKTLVCSRI